MDEKYERAVFELLHISVLGNGELSSLIESRSRRDPRNHSELLFVALFALDVDFYFYILWRGVPHGSH